MKYSLSVFTATSADNVHTVTDIRTGSLALVSFAAKEAKAELDAANEGTDFRVELSELDSEGNYSSSLLKLTADAGTVGEMLKSRLARVRKVTKATEPALTAQEREQDTDGTYPV